MLPEGCFICKHFFFWQNLVRKSHAFCWWLAVFRWQEKLQTKHCVYKATHISHFSRTRCQKVCMWVEMCCIRNIGKCALYFQIRFVGDSSWMQPIGNESSNSSPPGRGRDKPEKIQRKILRLAWDDFNQYLRRINK